MNAHTPLPPAKPAHAPQGHPSVPPARIGVLLANLGTPDGHDYWSMRRYLNEFLSDQRVIDYPRWEVRGRHLVDTWLLVQFYDVSARELESYVAEGFRAVKMKVGWSGIPLREDARACGRIRQVSVASLLADTILRISNEESVSSLFME